MKRLWKYQDQTLEVTLLSNGDAYELKIGDQKYLVQIAEISTNLYSISIDGKVYEIKTDKIKSDKNYLSIFRLLFKNQDIKVELINPIKQPLDAHTAVSGGSEKIFPPMHGRVIKILAKTNDSVMPGDTLLILEAMKMQNEIKASIEGKIKFISVSEGSVVDPSVSMIEIIPHLKKE